ncbi:MAG: hypothetical protein OHK0039_26570 [Bacteroidia bacterium]
MRISLLTSLVLICLASPLRAQLFPQLGAQRAGISALTFLKMDISPRAAGLGGADVCLSGDAYATHTNPANLSEVGAFAAAASHTFWAADINYSYLSASQATGLGTFGVSLSGLNSGPMEVRTTFQPGGTGELFYAYYLTAGLSYSKALTDQFSWGTSLRFVQERLASFTANTVVADLGFLYRTDFKDLRFAVVLQNFGPNSTLKGSFDLDTTFSNRIPTLEAYPAPTVFKLGISMVPWQSADGHQSLTTYVQLNHPNDNAENLRLGVEYAYRQLLFLRAGYKINVKDQPYPTAGIGLRMRAGRYPLVLDYAFDPLEFLGTVHRVGLAFYTTSDTER